MSIRDHAQVRRAAETRTFGDHQEDTAAALNQLLRTLEQPAATPTQPGDVEQLLACRHALLDGINERLLHLTSAGHRLGRTVLSPMPLKREHITERPAAVLEYLAATLPRRPPSGPHIPSAERMSPVEALGRPSSHPTVEHWRHVAVGVLVGNQILDQAAEQPWLNEPGAGWYVLGDLAAILEAVTVLDAAYDELGLLAAHRRPAATLDNGPATVVIDRRAWTLEERRMAAAQVARMAGWYATTSTADLAVLGSSHTNGPVRLVAQPADLIAGQRQLAHHLRHRRAHNAFATPHSSMDTATLRAVTRSQIELLDQLQAYATRTPRSGPLAAGFGRYHDMLADVRDHSRTVFDAHKRPPNSRALWQQQEISNAARRLGPDLHLNARQLTELLSATHDVVHTLAAATRHEITLGATTMRTADRGLSDQRRPHTRLSHKHPLYVALNAIIAAAAPLPAAHPATFPERRRTLAATLDATPTARPPSPYRLGSLNATRGPGR